MKNNTNDYVNDITNMLGNDLSKTYNLKYLGHTEYKSGQLSLEFATSTKQFLVPFEIVQIGGKFWTYDEFELASRLRKILENKGE